jgi:ABC-type lipoprotein export system ATPase subunit
MTVLAVSHQTGMATIADRVLRLHDGVLVAAAPELKGYAADENQHGKQVSGS